MVLKPKAIAFSTGLVRVGAEMPERPCIYRIVEPGILSEEIASTTMVAAPRLPHADVEKLHPVLVAPRSHLGKHGVQEYLLEHAAEHNLPPRPTAQQRKRGRRRAPHPGLRRASSRP